MSLAYHFGVHITVLLPIVAHEFMKRMSCRVTVLGRNIQHHFRNIAITAMDVFNLEFELTNLPQVGYKNIPTHVFTFFRLVLISLHATDLYIGFALIAKLTQSLHFFIQHGSNQTSCFIPFRCYHICCCYTRPTQTWKHYPPTQFFSKQFLSTSCRKA